MSENKLFSLPIQLAAAEGEEGRVRTQTLLKQAEEEGVAIPSHNWQQTKTLLIRSR